MKDLLEKLERQGDRRFLKESACSQKYIIFDNKPYLNLSSNDYLALADVALQKEFFATLDTGEFLLSNPASRLMTGNSHHYTEIEDLLASMFGKEGALLLSSGFMLNSGALPALTEPQDLIVADKLVHASIIDGMRQCKCRWVRYRHNDMADLRKIVEKEKPAGRIFIVTESIFSMDGDIAPLEEIVKIKEEYGAKLYLDEAHAFGVRGKKGLGISEELGLTDKVDYLAATLGKALASQGGFIVCDALSREVLINRMRTLIFSTALPPVSLIWGRFLLQRLDTFNQRREHLAANVAMMRKKGIEASSHIVPVIIGDSKATLEAAGKLREAGIWCSAIRTPTVPEGSERLRFSLTAALNDVDMENITDQIVALKN